MSHRSTNAAQPSSVSVFEHQKLPSQDHGSLDDENDSLAGYQASHRIPRKPISSHDSIRKISRADRYTKSESFDNGKNSSPASSQNGRLEVFSVWWLEMVCCIIFTGAFLAIVATIYSYEGRPLPEWPYHLTINTLIALYVVILKAALLLVTAQGLGQLKWRWFDREHPLNHLTSFDDASRGAWGSLKLLWMLKEGHIIASCGALVSAAALLIDPFAQQVISTYPCILPFKSSQATLPRTNYFVETGPHVGAGENALPVDLQNVINGGIFNPGTQVAFECPSGNCTFPDLYHSVGYCGSCNDTTNDLVYAYEVIPGGVNYTNISLPGYWITYPGYTDPVWLPPVTTLLNGTDTATSNGTLYNSNTAYLLMQSIGDDIAVVVSQINDSLSTSCPDEMHWGCHPPINEANNGVGAASCNISPCVRTYNASIAGGRLSDQLVGTSSSWVMDSILFGSVDYGLSGTVYLHCLPSKALAQVSELEFKSESGGWLSTPNLTTNDVGYGPSTKPDFWIPTGNGPNITIPADCVYLTDYDTNDAILAYLETYLNGTIGIVSGNDYAYDYAGTPQLLAIYDNSNVRFEDLNEIFANISDSLTTHIRQNGIQNFSTPAYGSVLHEQTCVHVRWPWLAYPAVLVLLTLIFLAAMIAETRRGETKSHDWKNESLALMFHRLDGETFQTAEAARLVKRRDMQDAAKQMYVIFAVIDEDLKEGEDKLAIVLERQLSYFSDLESLGGLLEYLGDSPCAQIFTVIAEGFNKELPRAPFTLWQDIDSEFQDLVAKMTNINPKTRITAHEALSHQWFTGLV